MRDKRATFIAKFSHRSGIDLCSISDRLLPKQKNFLLTSLARSRPEFVFFAVLFASTYGPLISEVSAQVGDQGARSLALYKEHRQAEQRESGPWQRAASGLELCAAARHMSYREKDCTEAANRVALCIEASTDWKRRRTALLADIRKADPKLGLSYSSSFNPIRGERNWANAEDRWNDSVRALESMELPACPQTVPGTFLTPEAALKEWIDQDNAPVAALPRRGGGAATDRFRDANSLAESEQNNPKAKEARLKAEQEEQARIKREYAEKKGTEEVLLSSLFSAVTAAARIQAQRNPSDPSVALLSALTGGASGGALGGPSGGSDAMPSIGGSGSAQNSGSGSSGASCEDSLNSLIGPVNETRPPAMGYIQSSEQGVWDMQVYLQAANSLPACASSPARQIVAQNLSKAQSACQQARGSNCTSGRNYHVNVAKVESAIAQLQLGSTTASSQQGGGSQGGAGSNACEQEYSRKDSEMSALKSRTQSVVAISQLTLYMIDELRRVLDSPVCNGQPARQRIAGLMQMRQNTETTCKRQATNPSDCQPRRP